VLAWVKFVAMLQMLQSLICAGAVFQHLHAVDFASAPCGAVPVDEERRWGRCRGRGRRGGRCVAKVVVHAVEELTVVAAAGSTGNRPGRIRRVLASRLRHGHCLSGAGLVDDPDAVDTVECVERVRYAVEEITCR